MGEPDPDRKETGGGDEERPRVQKAGLLHPQHVVGDGRILGVEPAPHQARLNENRRDRQRRKQHCQRHEDREPVLHGAPRHDAPPCVEDVMDHHKDQRADADRQPEGERNQPGEGDIVGRVDEQANDGERDKHEAGSQPRARLDQPGRIDGNRGRSRSVGGCHWRSLRSEIRGQRSQGEGWRQEIGRSPTSDA